MLIKEEFEQKPILNNDENKECEIDLEDINKSAPFTLEPQSFLQENENKNAKNSERITQKITRNLQDKKDKIKRAKTISFPFDDKEKVKVSDINFKSPDSTLRLRNKENNNIRSSESSNTEISSNSTSSNKSSSTNSTNKIKKEIPLILKENVGQANFFTRKIHWSWILLFLAVCAVVVYMMFRLETIHVEDQDKKIIIKLVQLMPLENFAESTEKLVEDIIQVDLPCKFFNFQLTSGSVMDGTVSCRRFANIVEDSPAFKETGSSIAKLLRAFSDKIMGAGVALEDMYRNGDMLFWVLNNEISDMISKLNPSLFERLFENEDKAFFRSRIQELINSIEEFRGKVTVAKNAIVDAETYRNSAEKKVRQGIIEATKFIHHGPNIHEYRLKLSEKEYYLEKVNDEKAIDVLNAMDELKHAENILKILEKSHEALDLINKILISYRNSLIDVESQLGKIGKSKITKKDLNKLEKLVDILKTSQQKFIGKDTLGDKESSKIYV
ncbi:hypothetical protein C1645_734526 [Glomus cerebriforme]|uniref:Uncharacterized protein n=1 Tax=Glomus cerebriforme TaxID=658196 RepID=A0A397T9C3_9GLOM|nr:hypothetical protein C1645_734526 [Glomus cerebriforme]